METVDQNVEAGNTEQEGVYTTVYIEFYEKAYTAFNLLPDNDLR